MRCVVTKADLLERHSKAEPGYLVWSDREKSLLESEQGSRDF